MFRFLLWFLFVALTPAGPELVEWGAHYAQEGDFADAADAGHRRAPADQTEHGCTVLSHSCGCHGPTAPVREVDRRAQDRVSLRTVRWPSLDLSAPLPAPEPVTRPPIA